MVTNITKKPAISKNIKKNLAIPKIWYRSNPAKPMAVAPRKCTGTSRCRTCSASPHPPADLGQTSPGLGEEAQMYPLVIERSYWKSPFLMGKLTISMAIFNSYVSHYQRVGMAMGQKLGHYIYIFNHLSSVPNRKLSTLRWEWFTPP